MGASTRSGGFCEIDLPLPELFDPSSFSPSFHSMDAEYKEERSRDLHLAKGSEHSSVTESRCSSLAAGVSSMARYKTMSPASLPIARSSTSCLTIPPGLSPTTLLESPVFLSNLAEPSPTTGAFSFRSYMNHGVTSGVVSDMFSSSWNASKKHFIENGDSPRSFEFRPHQEQDSLRDVPPSSITNAEKHHTQSHDQTEPQVFVKVENVAFSAKDLTLSVMSSDSPVCMVTKLVTSANISSDESQIRKDPNVVAQQVLLNQKGVPLAVVEKPSEDGYNWRKYGQKLVKGCEFPRSYYKCTHPNCQVKKKLERSHDGQVAAIIYEGVHDHPKPQPSRRLAVGASNIAQGDHRLEEAHPSINTEGKSPPSPGQACNNVEANGTTELSSLSASDDDDIEASAADGDKINDEVDEDPQAKRRKLDAEAIDVTTTRTREPRVVVQTQSEVDILDDGYRWRKYGQKVVKGNPNPRSYYKCTNAGCQVRKHVERASNDPKSVITTYEGKHNHDVPTSSSTSHEPSRPTAVQSFNPPNVTIPAHLNTVMVAPTNHINGSQLNYIGVSNGVSLDLGVGMSRAVPNGIQMQNLPDGDGILGQVHNSRSLPMGGMNGSTQRVLPFYGNSGVAVHGIKEEDEQSFNLSMIRPLNHFRGGAGELMLGQEVDGAHMQSFTRGHAFA